VQISAVTELALKKVKRNNLVLAFDISEKKAPIDHSQNSDAIACYPVAAASKICL